MHLVTTSRIIPKTTEKEVLKAADTVETRGQEAIPRTDIASLDQGAEVVQGEVILETREVAGLPEEAEIVTPQTEDLVTCTEMLRNTDLEETTQDQTEPHLIAKGLKSEGIDPKAGMRIESALIETTNPLASDQPRNTVLVRTKRKMPLPVARTPIQSLLNSRKRSATATNASLN